MRRNISLLAVPSSIAIAVAAACSSSSSGGNGSGTGNGNGDDSTAAPSDAGVACGFNKTCAPAEVCCYDNPLAPTCAAAGSCRASTLRCSAKGNCGGGQVCCFTYEEDGGATNARAARRRGSRGLPLAVRRYLPSDLVLALEDER